MLCRKSIFLALAFGLSLRLPAEPADLGEPAEEKPPVKVALHAREEAGETTGWEQHRQVTMKVGDRRLMLVVPQGFRANTTDPEKVILFTPDYGCVLSFRIAALSVMPGAVINAGVCRAWLSARLKDMSIQEEFPLTAAIGSGIAFDLRCKVDGLTRSSRVAFILSPSGVLEFSALCSPERFEATKTTLRLLIRGFQISDASGKLESFPTQSDS